MAGAARCRGFEGFLQIVLAVEESNRLQEQQGLFRCYDETRVPETLLPALTRVIEQRSQDLQASLAELYHQCRNNDVDSVCAKEMRME